MLFAKRCYHSHRKKRLNVLENSRNSIFEILRIIAYQIFYCEWKVALSKDEVCVICEELLLRLVTVKNGQNDSITQAKSTSFILLKK